MERRGCDGRESSGLVKNECGNCGKKSCKRCDGSINSNATLNECKICVLGTTGRTENHGKDCKGFCNGPHVNPEECPDKCIDSRGKKKVTCLNSGVFKIQTYIYIVCIVLIDIVHL